MRRTPNLPEQSLPHLPSQAQERLIDRGPFETYGTVAYEGLNGSVFQTGLFVETDADTWIENDLFTFQEVRESDQEIVLYDASRETTIFINLTSNSIFVQFDGNELVWEVTDVTQSLTPLIPDGWTL